MPVIRHVPQDPTDLVIQGEQLRQSVFDPNNVVVTSAGLLMGSPALSGFSELVPDEDALAPMNSMCEIGRLSVRRMKNGTLQQRSNAGISTPCGAWIDNDWSPLLRQNVQAGGHTQYWLTGVSRDSSGAALGNCTVKIFRTLNDSKMHEVVSNASGVWSIQVSEPGTFYYVEYKAGSPDVAGTSLNTNVPTTVN